MWKQTTMVEYLPIQGLNKAKIQNVEVAKDINHVRIVVENFFLCIIHSKRLSCIIQ